MNTLYAFVFDVVAFANPSGNATEISNRYIAKLGMQPPAVQTLPSSVSVPSISRTPASRASSSESQTVLGKCSYVIKKKTGETEVCGKNAKNELCGKFYCGTDKSGHYSSERKKAGAASTPSASGVSAVAVRASTASTASATALLQRIKGIQPSDSLLKPQRVMGTSFFVIRSNRILIDPNSNEAYGVLDENNKDIIALNSENLAFLKQHNISVKSTSRHDSVESQPVDEVVDEESEVDDVAEA